MSKRRNERVSNGYRRLGSELPEPAWNEIKGKIAK